MQQNVSITIRFQKLDFVPNIAVPSLVDNGRRRHEQCRNMKGHVVPPEWVLPPTAATGKSTRQLRQLDRRLIHVGEMPLQFVV